MVFDYLDAGADDEISLRRGKDAYSELEMHFHILSGLKPPLDLRTKIFGQDVKLPFFGCPTAGNRMFHWVSCCFGRISLGGTFTCCVCFISCFYLTACIDTNLLLYRHNSTLAHVAVPVISSTS
jgi:isopentenyl diphosphate isomerase/L-lactate dehydrogenase-like FMN-dependent dehydrogenase